MRFGFRKVLYQQDFPNTRFSEYPLEVTFECPECRELEEPLEGCEICDGEGEYAQCHTIPWDKIKFIYSEAVKGLALQPNTAR